MGAVGRGGGARRDRRRRMAAPATGGEPTRRQTWRSRSRPAAGSLAPVGDLHATPEISPDGSAVIFYRDTTKAFSGDGMQLRQLNSTHARTRAHGPFQKSRILVARLAVVRVYRRDQPEEDARAGRRAGNCRERCCHYGGRELERQRHAAHYRWRQTTAGLYAVSAAGGVAKRIDVTGCRRAESALVSGRSFCRAARIFCSCQSVERRIERV